MIGIRQILWQAERVIPSIGKLMLLRLSRQNPSVAASIAFARERNSTYLSTPKLIAIARCVGELEKRGVEGEMLEAGCALGGSALVIAAAKKAGRRLCLYDTFTGIPSPTDKDGNAARRRYESIAEGTSKGIAGETYYGYRKTCKDDLLKLFRDRGLLDDSVAVIEGMFQDTMNATTPLCFAHLDCDWYESVSHCLRHVDARLVPGGIIMIDDYDRWAGCKRAVDDFLRKRRSAYSVRKGMQLKLVRTSAQPAIPTMMPKKAKKAPMIQSRIVTLLSPHSSASK